MAKPRKKLGELLVEAGVIDEYQLRSALSHQQQWGGRLGANLVKLGLVGESRLVAFLAKHFRLPAIDFSRIRVSDEVLRKVGKDLAQRHHVLPLFFGEESGRSFLAVAMSNPADIVAQDELEFAVREKIRPVVASDTALNEAIAYYYDRVGQAPYHVDAKFSEDMTYADLIRITREYLKGAAEPTAPRAPSANEIPVREIDLDEDTQAEDTGASDPEAADDDLDGEVLVFGAAGAKSLPLDNQEGKQDDATAKSARKSGKQVPPDRVLRALVELLEEKGVITRRELRERLR